MSIQHRWVEGKTIKRVDFRLIPSDRQSSRPPYQSFERIVFTDGSAMYFSAVETEDNVDVEASYLPSHQVRRDLQ